MFISGSLSSSFVVGSVMQQSDSDTVLLIQRTDLDPLILFFHFDFFLFFTCLITLSSFACFVSSLSALAIVCHHLACACVPLGILGVQLS
jgi:hypothetical protein